MKTKNFSFYATGQIVATLFHALFFIVFASFLTPETFGELSFWISIAGISSVIARFGLPYSVTIYQAKNNTLLVNQVNSLGVIFSIIAFVILLFYDLWISIFALGISLFWFSQHNLLGQKKYKILSTTLIIQSILFLTIPLLLYFFFDIIGILLGLALANLLCSFHFFKNISKNINSFQEIKKNWKIIIHNFAVDLSISLPTILDKILIVYLYGFVFNGIYHFNMQILAGLSILPYMLHGYLLSEESSQNDNRKLIYLIITVNVILVLFSVLLAPIFVDEFYPAYSEGILSLQVLVIASIPLTLASVFSAKLQARESTLVGYSLLIRIVPLLILIYALGGLYGLVGLSTAVLISNTSYVIFLGLMLRKS